MAPGCDLGWHPRSPRFVHVRRDARSQIGKRSGRREIVVADQFVLGAEQVDGRWIWDNPAERAHRIVAAPPEICPPTPAELRSLLDFVADRDPLLQVFRFTAVTAVTGARRAQLLGLRWRSIDLERARISFYRGWVEGPDGPVLTSTKTNALTVSTSIHFRLRFSSAFTGHFPYRRHRTHTCSRRRRCHRMEAEPCNESVCPPSPRRRASPLSPARSPPFHGHRDAASFGADRRGVATSRSPPMSADSGICPLVAKRNLPTGGQVDVRADGHVNLGSRVRSAGQESGGVFAIRPGVWRVDIELLATR